MITLKDIGINETNKTYIIAEIGINHGGSLDQAKALINLLQKQVVMQQNFKHI